MKLARRLKTQHLLLILRIAETGQLQVAAGSVAMSQPAASRVLADIESQVGAPLFERHPKGMEPTQVGGAFIRHARAILAEFENLESEVESVNAGNVGEVRIGAVTGPAVGILVPAILEIKKATPRIELTVDVGPSNILVQELAENHLDFVIARLPPDHDSRAYKVIPARREVATLLVRKSHPLAKLDHVPLADLADYEWVVQERGNPIRQAMEDAFHANGLAMPQRITNSSSLLVVLAMLVHSDAIAPASEEVAQLLTGELIGAGLSTLKLEHPISISPYFIIQNRAQILPRASARVLDEILSRL